MNEYVKLAALRDVDEFIEVLQRLNLHIPCDRQVLPGNASPLARSAIVDGLTIGNRFAVQPMEGWDGALDGRPSEMTFRRWRRFGSSGAKLIWGGEAVAVQYDGRANPNQLVLNEETYDDLARLRDALVEEHRKSTGSTDGLVIGLQLTHSGRYSRPEDKPEPRILYRHPILDKRLNLPEHYPVLTDGEVRQIIDSFIRAAKLAWRIGFHFVDIKHCHGYLGHEFLSAYTRSGDYGGRFENRTRFLREVVQGIRTEAAGLSIGVRLSAFDMIPFRPDPVTSRPGKPGVGVPEPYEHLLPYRWGFGVNPHNPTEPDLSEPASFLALLRALNIQLVNLSAGSPYYNPHIQRPALYPPSDGYQPPEDPLVGVARQMWAVRTLKERFPDLTFVGTAYTYLQEYIPYVAQAAVREGWTDFVGLGRMMLAYPELPRDVLEGSPLQTKRLCRTFSDCTTAPRNGLPSGCYPLDEFYKRSPMAEQLKQLKHGRTKAG
ncbi:MAG: NADH:flavin oxidoreductase [Armatimonadota bacterium]|nr:NADH:flavin oxidoreductase [bacterium]MDW8322078.1 NADH:flavin oxidoreductase [Armatimonadota bacterium]